MRAPVFTLAALIVAAAAWWFGGVFADRLGIGDLDLPLRAGLIFVLLGAFNALSQRFILEDNQHV